MTVDILNYKGYTIEAGDFTHIYFMGEFVSSADDVSDAEDIIDELVSGQ